RPATFFDSAQVVYQSGRDPEAALRTIEETVVHKIGLHRTHREMCGKPEVDTAAQLQRPGRIPGAVADFYEGSALPNQEMAEKQHISTGENDLRTHGRIAHTQLRPVLPAELRGDSEFMSQIEGGCDGEPVQAGAVSKSEWLAVE